MKRIVLAVAAAALVAPALALAQTSSWKIDDAHSHTSFTVRHMVISNVRGEFGKTAGTLVLDEKDPTRSTVEATIQTATVDTRVSDRDNHLRSPDFFDATKYPTMTFKSTKVERAGDGKLKVTGNLTIRDVTRPVVLEVTGPTAEVKDPWGNVRRGVSATGKIDRRDFGLTWNKMVEAGPVVGNDVQIEIEAELIKQAPGKTASN
jgi:polyisoprenoid-binding protein YceI